MSGDGHAGGAQHAVRWAAVVRERVGVALDAWAVAATLEAEGLRDEDVRARFEARDLFAFAREVHAVLVGERAQRSAWPGAGGALCGVRGGVFARYRARDPRLARGAVTRSRMLRGGRARR